MTERVSTFSIIVTAGLIPTIPMRRAPYQPDRDRRDERGVDGLRLLFIAGLDRAIHGS
jgi:hypothetical protein